MLISFRHSRESGNPCPLPLFIELLHFTLLLFGNVRKLMDGPDPLFMAGEGAVTEYFSKSMYFVVRIFGIRFLSKQVSKLNARANRVKEVTLAELTDKSARFEIHKETVYLRKDRPCR